MTRVDETKLGLRLPPVSQIGFVVSDVDRMVENYMSICGLGPWTVYEFAPDHYWFMEEPAEVRLKMGKCVLGDIELVLAQPLEGRSLHQEFLETHGDGVHSLTFNTLDYDQMCDDFVRAGFAPVMRVDTHVETYGGQLKACYFDTQRICGTLLEIRWASWLREP